MIVVKRDGSVVEFDNRKVKKSILMAFSAADEHSMSEVDTIVESVSTCLRGYGDRCSVSQIQQCTENALMEYGYSDVARQFITYRAERDRLRAARMTPDASAIADYIHAAKYARYSKSLGRRETYSETVNRVMDMHIERYPDQAEQIRDAFDLVRSKRILPSMRSMQFGGAAIVDNHCRMYNCSGTLIDRVRVFSEVLYLLLCGCGVGYSVQWQHVLKLPAVTVVDRRVFHYSIPDTIEGWARGLDVLMRSFLMDDCVMYGNHVEFDYSKIRAEGAPLHASGGRAPGHLDLKIMLENVRSLLQGASGRQLRPIECNDILCHIATAVLAGGIRRSSMIALFSSSDTEMMYSKVKGTYDPSGQSPDGTGHPQRAMANISAVILRNDTSGEAILERCLSLAASNYGEPGYTLVDSLDTVINPCGEISLDPVWVSADGTTETGFGFCNLVEVNGAACGSEVASHGAFNEACAAAAFIATLQAGYTSFGYLGTCSQMVAERDALIGVSITGIMDNPKLLLDPAVLWAGANIVVEENARVASLIGIQPAARCTCIKPSGTASLELGCVGSGIHPHHARRYFRRILANIHETPFRFFAAANPHMVAPVNDTTAIITFPVQAPTGAALLGDIVDTDFIDVVSLVQEHWVCSGGSKGPTNNVSCTVPIVNGVSASYLWSKRSHLCAAAFAAVGLDKVYQNAPREAVVDSVDEEKWNMLIRLYKPVDWSLLREGSDSTTVTLTPACAGGACEL